MEWEKGENEQGRILRQDKRRSDDRNGKDWYACVSVEKEIMKKGRGIDKKKDRREMPGLARKERETETKNNGNKSVSFGAQVTISVFAYILLYICIKNGP